MKAMLEFLVGHGGMLLIGVSAVLLFGVVLVMVQRQPIGRQRVAEGTMMVCVVWLILACVPLPRFVFNPDRKKPAPTRTLEMYRPEAGDDEIAAEVFRVATSEAQRPAKSTGIGVPLPMPPAQTTPVAVKRNWALIGAGVYVGGVILCALYMVLGHVLLRRLLRRSRECPARPDLHRRVRVRICEECDRPISFGVWRATILLPASFESLDVVKQRHILRHELAHISQRDALGHFLFNLLFVILYFHPLYWVLRRKTNLARELIADDVAAGNARESYVADLLALARERLGHAAMATHALGLFGSDTDLYRRMHMLMQSNGALARRCSNFWRVGYSTLLAMALVVMVGTMGVRRAQAQKADPEGKAAEVELRTAQEQASVAAQRQDEVALLRAQQAQILEQLKALEVEKRQLQAELAQRKSEGAKADDVAAIYRQKLAQRGQASQQAQEAQAGTIEAKLAARRRVELGVDAQPAPAQEKLDDERQAMRQRNKNPVGRDQNEGAGRAQLDLVALADRYVDAKGSLELAELELQQLTATVGPEQRNAIARGPAAKLKVQTANRKLAIFRGIAEAAMEAAKSDLDLAMQQFKGGLVPQSAVTEAKSRVRILEVILAQ